jgi:hypothetical protein
MEITVLYFKIARHQLSISWSQISVYWLLFRVASKLNLRPSNLQLLPLNFKIQYSYLLNIGNPHNLNVFMSNWNNGLHVHRSLRFVDVFETVFRFSLHIMNRHDITKKLLKVALSTINPPSYYKLLVFFQFIYRTGLNMSFEI